MSRNLQFNFNEYSGQFAIAVKFSKGCLIKNSATSSSDEGNHSCVVVENSVFYMSNKTVQIQNLRILLNSLKSDYENLFFLTDSQLTIDVIKLFFFDSFY